jgi:tripartite-type tricarboxylate transporter receptor subunit TctC
MRAALRRIFAVAVFGLLHFTAPHTAAAQGYPTRPITIIVPYPAGGPSDVLTRVLAERMKAALGQTVIIENVTGAGGSIGVGRVARSAPDGYTLAIGHNQTHVINAASMNLPYDVVKDFEPISLIADTPQWLISRKTLPANNVKDLIAWLKANKATAGAVGVGGPTDLSALSFQKETSTTFQFVPYRGGAPLLQDLVAGQIDIAFGQAANYLGPVRGGQLKAFAVLSKQRWWAAPDVPTMDEAGVPGLHASFWHGLWAPKGTPKDIIAKLDAAVIETLADPAVQQRLKDIGQEPWPRDKQTPEALAQQQKNEIAVWWPVIKANNIKGE